MLIGSKNLDLNLLTAFDALFSERNVTRAARRVGLSQPAMSNALARLRRAFDDELFVRTPGGIEPTERATQIALEIREGLSHIERALNPIEGFDPGTARRAFTLVATDYTDMVILPNLIERLAEQAPGIDLRVVSAGRALSLEMLDRGEVDFGFYVVPEAPKRIVVQTLMQERFVCVARRNHPALKNGLDITTYAGLSHILFSLSGDPRGTIDTLLAERGYQRRIALTVAHFLSIPVVLQKTDYVSTVGLRVAQQFASMGDITIFELPFTFPSWTIHLFWSRRSHGDPANRWLRETVITLCREL